MGLNSCWASWVEYQGCWIVGGYRDMKDTSIKQLKTWFINAAEKHKLGMKLNKAGRPYRLGAYIQGVEYGGN